MKIFFKNQIIKKVFVFTIILSILLPYFTFPKKTNALVFTDPAGLVQTTFTAIRAGYVAVSVYAVEFKEYVLDGLAGAFARQIIRTITSSVVQWINDGFEGSPSFLQNPNTFFLDLADQLTGEFISRNGDLGGLCSAFSIDIRLALSLKYRPNVPRRYLCTLGTMINNSKNAVAGATINGFTAGDFRQGGWPAFVSLTTEPQNNIYGAYIQADSDLSWRVASAHASQRQEINNGQGFLSWRDPKCKKEAREWNKKLENTSEDTAINAYNSGGAEGLSSATLKNENDCPIQTPGSVISSSLNNHLGSGLRQLELADEFNEIVNALFAQLANQVLQKGLTAVSARDQSGSSYLSQTVSDINASNDPQFLSIKKSLLDNTERYMKSTTDYQKNRDAAINVMLDAKSAYDSVKSCYLGKINAIPPSLSGGQIQIAQSNLNDIDSIIRTKISDRTLNLLSLSQDADNRFVALKNIQDKTNNAQTLNDLNEPSVAYSRLQQAGKLATEVDVAKSKEDLDAATSEVAELKNDASRKMQMCQTF